MEHIEKHPEGFATCRHCGGEVGDDGYSMGGVLGDDMEAEGEEMSESEISRDMAPEQGVAGDRMRDDAFADSLRRRKGAR